MIDSRTAYSAGGLPRRGNGPLRVAFQTLGCKLNQYETDALASRFQENGYCIVPFDEPADCYIVNTCTVTNKGARKSRNAVNRAVRRHAASIPVAQPSSSSEQYVPAHASSNALVVVTGCFAESHRDELENDDRIVTVGNDRKQSIFELVEARMNGEMLGPHDLPTGVFDYGVPQRIFHTRSMIKIQDGCDNFCSFCIIPHVRGRARSRNSESIQRELEQSLDAGYREIVLTGVNISRYSDNGVCFSELVERLLETPGDYRLRISSLEPDQLDERFFRLFGHERMAPHLHLCLQSGSDKILLQMRRQYTVDMYRRYARRLLTDYPGFNLTTDCITGFPGETKDDFESTCSLIDEIGFSHVHTFPYSVRSGTRAQRMPGQIDHQEKKARAQRLRQLSLDGKRRYRTAMVGTRERMLVERVEGGVALGYTGHYIPVRVPCSDLPHPDSVRNRFVDVTLRGIHVPARASRNAQSGESLDDELHMSAVPTDRVSGKLVTQPHDTGTESTIPRSRTNTTGPAA